MISIPNMYPKYTKKYWTSKILIYYMKVGGSITWRLMVEDGRWILKYLDLDFVFVKQCFSFHENLVFVLCFYLFGFLFISKYVYFSFDFEWSRLMFLIFESILLKFWLQNRYKSGILKLKNRFYSCFGYKIGKNQVLLNRKTDWDPNPKVYWVVPVLWRFTNPDPNPIEPEPDPNRTFI